MSRRLKSQRYDSKSVQCYIFLLAGRAISCKSTEQSIVATSSTESDFRIHRFGVLWPRGSIYTGPNGCVQKLQLGNGDYYSFPGRGSTRVAGKAAIKTSPGCLTVSVFQDYSTTAVAVQAEIGGAKPDPAAWSTTSKQRIRKGGIKTRPPARYKLKKSSIGYPSVHLLGFEVDAFGLATTEERIQALATRCMPTNLADLKTHLGMATFLRIFVYKLQQKA